MSISIVDTILNAIGTVIYPMFTIIFTLIDVVEGLFTTFAGTGSVVINGTTIGAGNSGLENDTGLVYYLLNTSIVRNILISISTLALFLVIIFTAMAFIKNIYSSQPKNWKEIVGNAIKGLANFIFLPACCLLGVWLGNILLNAIDGATSTADSISMSRQLFTTSAYNANRIRNGTFGDGNFIINESEYNQIAAKCSANGITIRAYSGDANGDGDYEYYAEMIDKAYSQPSQNLTWYWEVDPFYELMSINYILLAGGGIFILYCMFWLTFGMIKRLFMLVFLYVVSPVLCAMYPLDGGTAVGGWKKQFISNTISAYGAVAGMNLFFSIAPLIQNIELSSATMPGTSAELVNSLGIISLLLTIAGLYVVKDFVSLINGYIGANDAMNDGKGLWSSVKDRVKGVRDKAGAKVSGAFAWTKRQYGRQKFFDEQVKSGAMTQEEARKELRRQELKDLADFGKKNTNKGLKFLTGIDRDKYKDSTDEGYNKADSEFRKRAAKEEINNTFKELTALMPRREELMSKDYLRPGEQSELEGLNKNFDKLIDKIEKLGVQDKVLKVTGLDADKYKSYKDTKKEFDSENKTYQREVEELNRIKKTYSGDTDFENMINNGTRYSAADMKGKTDTEIARMQEYNNTADRYVQLMQSTKDRSDALIKQTKKLDGIANEMNGGKGSGLNVTQIVKSISDLQSSLSGNDTTAITDNINKANVQIETLKTVTKNANESMAKTIRDKLDDIQKEIKRSEKGDKK